MSEHDWSVEAHKTLNSIPAFAAWFFTLNNFGNPQMANPNASFDAQSEEDFLPTEFHTTASTAKSSIRFIIDRRMFIVLIVLQALPILFCWVVLAWRIMNNLQGVKTSAFPLLDFFFKAELQKEVPTLTNPKSSSRKENMPPAIGETNLEDAGDREFIQKLKKFKMVAVEAAVLE